MVVIKDYHLRESETGSFISLELMGDVELVQSQQTGRFYATTRRCFISSTFDEKVAKLLLGKTLEGSIERVPCDSYDYTIQETGEIIKLAHSYDYVPLAKVMPKSSSLVSQLTP